MPVSVDADEGVGQRVGNDQQRGKAQHPAGSFSVAGHEIFKLGEEARKRKEGTLMAVHHHFAVKERPGQLKVTSVLRATPQVAIDLLGLLKVGERCRELVGPSRLAGAVFLQDTLPPVDMLQVRLAELGAEQDGVFEVGAVEVCLVEISLVERDVVKIHPEEVRSVQIGVCVIGVAEGETHAGSRTFQMHIREIDTPQLEALSGFALAAVLLQ